MERRNFSMDEVVSYCNQYGFIFQGSEIYGGLANTWDDTTLEQETVTVRDRDTMEQCVFPVSELISFLQKKLYYNL